jgi:hypothetical protein
MRKCQPLFRRPRDSPPMLTQRDQFLSQNKIRLKMSTCIFNEFFFYIDTNKSEIIYHKIVIVSL